MGRPQSRTDPISEALERLRLVDNLVGRLRQCIQHDIKIAKAAARCDDGRNGIWTSPGLESRFDARMDDHISRHDPARVLDNVQSQLLILDLHKSCNSDCYVVRAMAIPYAGESGVHCG